jgi:AcrR family transcriptional regulator
MTKGYDSTSISVLQEELNMSRGAMYRYFTNKEELFNAVIDKYLFKLFEKVLQNNQNDRKLDKYIEILYRRQRLVVNAFIRAGFTQTFFLNYTALIIQAAKYYPNFLNRFRIINDQLLEIWKNAIRNSIEAGEVRSDIDVDIMAILFNNASIKESSDFDCDNSFTANVMQDMKRRKEVMDYLYNLIKNI